MDEGGPRWKHGYRTKFLPCFCPFVLLDFFCSSCLFCSSACLCFLSSLSSSKSNLHLLGISLQGGQEWTLGTKTTKSAHGELGATSSVCKWLLWAALLTQSQEEREVSNFLLTSVAQTWEPCCFSTCNDSNIPKYKSAANFSFLRNPLVNELSMGQEVDILKQLYREWELHNIFVCTKATTCQMVTTNSQKAQMSN